MSRRADGAVAQEQNSWRVTERPLSSAAPHDMAEASSSSPRFNRL